MAALNKKFDMKMDVDEVQQNWQHKTEKNRSILVKLTTGYKNNEIFKGTKLQRGLKFR